MQVWRIELTEYGPFINEDDGTGMLAPCQPIGCDSGYHLKGCVYAARDSDEINEQNPLDGNGNVIE